VEPEIIYFSNCFPHVLCFLIVASFAHDASYICQKRWILTPEGDKTKVQLIDIYTESSQQSEESINSQIEGWNGHLAKLKEMAEG